MYSVQSVSGILSTKFGRLTLSPRAESTSRHLVAELTALLGRELLSFFRSEEPLIFIHVFLILLHANDVRKEALVAIILGAKRSVLGVVADLVDNASDSLLGTGIANRVRAAPPVGMKAVLLLLRGLLLLLLSQLLLSLLLSLGLGLG
jgi:hypothetical protein